MLAPRPDAHPGPATAVEPKLPLSFVPNRGQVRGPARYYAKAPGFAAYFERSAVTIVLSKGERGQVLQLLFRGARSHPTIEALDRRAGRMNYFAGSRRYTNVPTFGRVVYRDLWPHVDLAFAGARGSLKYQFLVQPGGDPADIRLAYAGADSVSVTGTGALAIHSEIGTIRDARPRTYQRAGDRTIPVASRYAVHGRRGYGFELAAYDHSRPLTIDPGLAYSTFLGGEANDRVMDIAVDNGGHAYVTGWTASDSTTTGPDYPTTPGAFDRTASLRDAFVTKLSADGSTLEYSTYLGGDAGGSDDGYAIAVDGGGNAYVTGETRATNFPTTPNAFDRTPNGGFDLFITKLDPTGSYLVYSTYFGGSPWRPGGNSGHEQRPEIAIDPAGSAYVIGATSSQNLPTTPGAMDSALGDDVDGFAAKLTPDGSALEYSTYLPDHSHDLLSGVAVDGHGSAYVTGTTFEPTFVSTPGAYDRSVASADAFVSKLDPTGSSFEYSTVIGGNSSDAGEGIAVDQAGNAYITGRTVFHDSYPEPPYPVTPGAYDTTARRTGSEFDGDGFVTKLNPTGSALVYSTYLGGSQDDSGDDIVVDSRGGAYVVGSTESADFPTTAAAFDSSYNGNFDVFVSVITPTGSHLRYSTFLGGSQNDPNPPVIGAGTDLAVDAGGDAYVGGGTRSTDFPSTPGAFDPVFGEPSTGDTQSDGFASKLAIGFPAPASLTLTPATATNTVGEGGHCVTATVADAFGDPTPGATVRFTVAGDSTATGTATTNASGEAEFCYQGPELSGTDQITGVVEPSGPSDTAVKTWVVPPSSENCRVTGGGQIRAGNDDLAIFENDVRAASTTSIKGRVRYKDRGPAAQLDLRSYSIDALVCDGRRATIFARDGEITFRIDLNDHGRAGRDDTYRIVTSSGYDSGAQALRRGNVTVR